MKRIAVAIALVAAVCLAGCSGMAKSIGGASSASSQPAGGQVELAQVTKVLEYSDKEVDPVTLVSCADPAVSVTTSDVMDLSAVGAQLVTYVLESDGETEERTLEFTVRDTKPPEISLKDTAIELQQGGEFDPASNIISVADPIDGALPQVKEEPALEAESGGDASASASEADAASGSSSSDAASQDDAPFAGGTERLYESGWYLVDGSVDVSTPATYTFTVLACDKHGNRATKQFQVTVAAAPVPEPAVEEAPAEAAAPAPAPAAQVHSYVLNTNTRKFHVPGCSSVRQMKANNRRDVEMTREDVISQGYEPCKRCNP